MSGLDKLKCPHSHVKLLILVDREREKEKDLIQKCLGDQYCGVQVNATTPHYSFTYVHLPHQLSLEGKT